ncbi:hypothetical protein LOTGIDRAFT_217539 [Lottia gigantea]|uniref:Glycosyl transferase CAP10 domain-containing protein n=1 Tax=Lottia gigantea TaxID=225164 RepID=V3ZI93_LOTGI|nr:hypothetical protein LOTGIDRAFT_217539 [Lottia gigantea]ESO90993.1 hypothetical protein LOTGIDRAFT_217539 [Lottia gigantea]
MMMHLKTLLFSFLWIAVRSKPDAIVWGPGLNSRIVLPVRYFFIQFLDETGENITESLGEKAVSLTIDQEDGSRARIWSQILDRGDGSYIARYRLYQAYDNLVISLLYNKQHIADSPYKLKGRPLYQEKCYCPIKSKEKWSKALQCDKKYQQIDDDLALFKDIDMKEVTKTVLPKFDNPGAHSLCHYKIIDNKIYRKTHGEHVGFKMFTDAMFLSLARKVKLPDVEFFVNLGDWPLVDKRRYKNDLFPIFSWCGSDETADIIMPTYDITESTIEMMGRVSLDIFSTQANTGPNWEEKIEKGFWRGRDSRQERLDLVMMSRKHPDLINASLTNMFFFPKDEAKYGKIEKAISFFDFFQYKYQINIDGTVAAYRLPYLLAGNSVVLKQDSNYYEYFYHQLKPYEHYIPFKRDLSDLIEKLNWAKSHDSEKYSKLLKSKPEIEAGFELVSQPTDQDSQCHCKRKEKVIILYSC